MKTYRLKDLFSLFMLFFCLQAVANPKIKTTSVPAWIRNTTVLPKQVNTADSSEGYYYEKVEYQVNLQQQATFYRTVKVLFDTNGAENAGQIYIDFDPTYQQLLLHELKIIRNGQTIDKLNLNNFELVATETELSRFIYNGTYTAYCVLDDLRKDDKIVFSYSLNGFNPVMEQKFSDTYFVQTNEPIGLTYVNYIVPNHRSLAFKTYNGLVNATIEKNQESTSYVWEIPALPAIEYTSFTPSWYTKSQWLVCSEFRSWEEVGNWANRINPVIPIQKGTALGNLVDQLWITAKGDAYVFLQKATQFVQNEVRYMGIEMGEYSHRANTPEKVFNQRYGDCKDKSVLLAAILRSKGINCSLVLVNTYLGADIANRLPSPYAFNHMTVEVNINGKKQFIDPTFTDQGGNIADIYYPNYEKALVLNSPKSLTTISPQGFGNTKITETYLFNDKGGAILEVVTQYAASDADIIRGYFKANARNQIQKQYLDYYKGIYPDARAHTPLVYEDNLADNKIKVIEKYSIDAITKDKIKNKKSIFEVYANHINEKLPEIKNGDDKAPIALMLPMTLDYSIKIVNFGGVLFKKEHENTSFDRLAYSFNKNSYTVKDTLIIDYSLKFKEAYVTASDRKQYIEDFKNKEDLLYNGFFIEKNGVLSGADIASSYSLLAIAITILIIVVFVIVMRKYIKTKPKYIIHPNSPIHNNPIRGWIVILLIMLPLSGFRNIYGFFNTGYLTTALWNAHESLEDHNEWSYKALIGIEFIMVILLILGIFFSVYLLIKKRDIFPQTTVGLLLLNLLYVVYIISFNYFYNDNEFSIPIFRTILICVVWIFYLIGSKRVKAIFVQPYKS